MSVALSPPAYDALEDLATNLLDRALVLSYYTAGPHQVPYEPCLALVVDSVNELMQFTLGVYRTVLHLEAEARTNPATVEAEDLYATHDLRAWLTALEEGGTSTFQHMWTDGQLVFYWPSVRVTR